MNHRKHIGASHANAWHEIGKFQYHFLITQGLEPTHKLLDVGCGSLRLGQWVIPYLKAGHYFGLDNSREIIDAGLEKEFYHNLINHKDPTLEANNDFDFSFMGNHQFDVAIANSLFSHLTLGDIKTCLGNLRKFGHTRSTFWFTFFDRDEREKHLSGSNQRVPDNPTMSHHHANFYHQWSDIRALLVTTGWDFDYVGNWNHPRNQQLVKAMPKS